MKKTIKWKLTRALTLSITGMASGLETAKAKVISGKPNAKLTHIQNVHKNTRQNTKFVKIKPEKDMARQQNKGHGRVTKH